MLYCTQVEFPGVGIMLTNRAGRFEFIFDSLLMEYFELEHAAVIKEVRYTQTTKRTHTPKHTHTHTHTHRGTPWTS